MKVDIGLNDAARKEVADSLSRFLADTYSLYLTTQRFHWNVTGPLFGPLHDLFQKQYEELAEAVDEIAERIRALGFVAPGSFTEFGELATIRQPEVDPGPMTMVRWLLEANEQVVRTARHGMPIAERVGDEATFDMYVERLRVHEKQSWILRAMLQNEAAGERSDQEPKQMIA